MDKFGKLFSQTQYVQTVKNLCNNYKWHQDRLKDEDTSILGVNARSFQNKKNSKVLIAKALGKDVDDSTPNESELTDESEEDDPELHKTGKAILASALGEDVDDEQEPVDSTSNEAMLVLTLGGDEGEEMNAETVDKRK